MNYAIGYLAGRCDRRGWLLARDVPLAAWRAACRYGDRLAFPPARHADGRYRSRVR